MTCYLSLVITSESLRITLYFDSVFLLVLAYYDLLLCTTSLLVCCVIYCFSAYVTILSHLYCACVVDVVRFVEF